MLLSTPPTGPKTALLLIGVLTLLTACAPRPAPPSSSLPPNPAAQADAPLASPELEPGDAQATAVAAELPQSTSPAAPTRPSPNGTSATPVTHTSSPPTEAPTLAPAIAPTVAPTDAPTAPPPPTDTEPSAPPAAGLPAALAAIAASPIWLNTAPFPPEALRGRVVIVEFWTYG